MKILADKFKNLFQHILTKLSLTSFEKKTYQDLINLVNNNEFFHFKDHELQGRKYRIFNYHLASWSSFNAPGALNCRGIMFDVTNPHDVKIASLPPEKFFNYEEGGIDHTQCKFGDKMVKMDGSLISTYINNGELYLKSKASLFSAQATDSMAFLNKAENAAFKDELKKLVELGYTVNLEYTAPTNRIVVSYQEEALTVLSVRAHKDGENFFASKLEKLLENKGGFPHILEKIVNYVDLRGQDIEHQKYVEDIRNETEGEGHVQEMIVNDRQSYLVKIKNLKYITLHYTKESINSPRRLFEAIINETSDDLRSMHADDPYVLDEIAKMEAHVQPIYNHIIKTIEDFYEANKHLNKKEFAMKAVSESNQFSGLMINHYICEKVASGEMDLGFKKDGTKVIRKPADYKEYSIKYRKELYGIGDEEKELDEDGNIIKNKPATASIKM